MERPRQPDLTVSIISADNLELLLPCLRSVFESTHRISLEVYLVDNASTDDTANLVEREYPQVQVIRNTTRLGFSTNNNMVLERGNGRHLMLLNDDTVVLDGALDRMVAFMDKAPQTGVVGGYLLNPDRSFQPAFAYFPHPLLEAFCASTNYSYRLLRPAQAPLEVDSVCGAAMLVRREVVQQVGALDTAFDPIYSEEVDWCYRIKRAGWRIFTLPEAQIVHYGSYTMNRAVPRKYELLLAHKTLFFRKHAGKLAADVYRTSLWLSTLVKCLWWTLAGLLRSGSSEFRERRQLHAYLLTRIRIF